MNPEPDRSPQPRRAFSIIEVSVAIAILGAAAVALSSGFSTGDGIVQASGEISWALRLATQQADLVRRQLAILRVNGVNIDTPSEARTNWVRIGEFAPTVTKNGKTEVVPQFRQPSNSVINLRGMAPPVPVGSPFYLLNDQNTQPADALKFVRDAQYFRVVLYMTQVMYDPQPGLPIRDLGGRKVMACQVDVYKGIDGTAANDPTGGKFLYSMTFLARRYDMDDTVYRGNGATNAGFWQP